ncbi:hypothetical protein [Paraburkholderia phenoliruptrix]|uniref:Uncharacterized protein n=1 Tax=Paraburkholderia phenoliruptrix TaxID=252970 RepID=A0ABV3W9S5_9BURK|nr:hypothetical protein [Paraburkholderia phenoliruptrix]
MSTVHSSHVVKTPVIVSFGCARDALRQPARASAPRGRCRALADFSRQLRSMPRFGIAKPANFQQKISFALTLVSA